MKKKYYTNTLCHIVSFIISDNWYQPYETLETWYLRLALRVILPGGMSFNWLFTYIYPKKYINTSPSIGIFTCKALSPFSSWPGGCVLSQIFLYEVELWVVVLLRALLCLLVCHAFCYDSCVSAFQGHWVVIWSLCKSPCFALLFGGGLPALDASFLGDILR